MKRVKWIFGVIVVLLAIYFANLASIGFNPKAREGSLDFSTSVDVRDLRAHLASLDLSEKPVLLDFWATWCRNCSAMERVTFHDREVEQSLRRDFTLVRVQAENPADPETAAVLREFNVIGVPAFRVVRAGN
jgi:thiol:disulfide interchange protein